MYSQFMVTGPGLCFVRYTFQVPVLSDKPLSDHGVYLCLIMEFTFVLVLLVFTFVWSWCLPLSGPGVTFVQVLLVFTFVWSWCLPLSGSGVYLCLVLVFTFVWSWFLPLSGPGVTFVQVLLVFTFVWSRFCRVSFSRWIWDSLTCLLSIHNTSTWCSSWGLYLFTPTITSDVYR